MDRLPRDTTVHHDILQLLDEYRVTSPGAISLHNGIPTSPNGLHAFMHPHKVKSKQRRNKNNGQMKDQNSYSPDGVKNGAKSKSKGKKKSGMQRNGHNESSSVGTLSPGDILESPNGYEMTPPRYDNVCGQGNMLGLHPSQMNGMDDPRVSCASMVNRMDDRHAMTNHYKNTDSMLEQHRQMEMLQQTEWLTMSASIPTPPSSNSSHSPMGMEGKLSPMKGGKMLPTSPPHYLAMQHLSQRNRPQKSPHHYHIDNYPFDQQQQQQNPHQQSHMDAHHGGLQYTDLYHPQHKVSTPMQIQPQPLPQYPTPPSQHSYTPPQQSMPPGLPENILTPSPDCPGDSPGQWSSSSPHSAHSDWSEGISSPVPPIGAQSQHMQNIKSRSQMSGDAVFI